MSGDQLKEWFQNDLERLKKLNVGIIPARRYYGDVLLKCLLIFALFLSLQLISCYVAIHTGAWAYVGEHEHRSTLSDDYDDFNDRMKLLDLRFERDQTAAQRLIKKQQLLAATAKRKQLRDKKENETREHYHVIRVAKMVGGVIGSSLFFMLFFVGKVKNYVIFKHQLKPKLQTGQFLAKKISLAFTVYFVLFWSVVMITIPLFDQDMTFFAGIAAFIFSGVIISFLINLEASRIGVSVLSSALVNYFDTTQKTSTLRD